MISGFWTGWSTPDLEGMLNLGCEQVMRFLGKQLNGQFGGEVVTDWRRGSEGVRLQALGQSELIKLYNCLNVLRPETTIHDAEDLKVFGPRKPALTPRWLGFLCAAGWRTFTGARRFKSV